LPHQLASELTYYPV